MLKRTRISVKNRLKIIFYTGIKICTRPPLLWCYRLWKGVRTPDRTTNAQLLSQLIPSRHQHFMWECINRTALTWRLPFITFLWLDQFVQGTYVSYAILSVNKMMLRLAIIKSASLREQHFSDTIYFSATKEQLRNIKAATSGWTLWGTPVIPAPRASAGESYTKASLGYITSSKPAWTTWQNHLRKTKMSVTLHSYQQVLWKSQNGDVFGCELAAIFT